VDYATKSRGDVENRKTQVKDQVVHLEAFDEGIVDVGVEGQKVNDADHRNKHHYGDVGEEVSSL
jgi:hypothetical protein